MSDACDALDALLAREAAAFERSAPTERLLGAVTPEVRDAAERVARWALDEDLLFAATAHALSRVVTQLDGGVLARAQPDACAELVLRLRLLGRVPGGWPLSQLTTRTAGARFLALVLLQMRPAIGQWDTWLRAQLADPHPLVRLQAAVAIGDNYGSIARTAKDGAWAALCRVRATLPLEDTNRFDQLTHAQLEALTRHLEATVEANRRARTLAAQRREAKRTARVAALGVAPVTFARSGRTVEWRDGDSLLELAQAHHLAPPSSCQAGTCGTCLTPLLKGTVRYLAAPAFEIDEGYCLLCIGIPDGPVTIDA